MCADLAPSLEIDVRRRLGTFHLEVSTRLPLDGITALFGPSGSGKTTLLRLIAGFETPDEGRIAFASETWTDQATRQNTPPHERSVGYMFQDGRLFEHLSAGGNLAYADKRSHGENGLTRSDVEDALDLRPLLKRRISDLSGGERQRVALGRTLLSRPKLLLLDEPLTGLDLARKAEILPYLEMVPEQFGIPTIYVSHSIDEVARLAKRMVVMNAGAIVAEGDTSTILDRLDLQPLTGRLEAGVVLDAEVRAVDERYQLAELDIDGQTLKLPASIDIAGGQMIRVRIQARDVALARSLPNDTTLRNGLKGTIEKIVADHGTPFAEVFVQLAEHHVRARITRLSLDQLALKEGEAVFALIKSASLDDKLV